MTEQPESPMLAGEPLTNEQRAVNTPKTPGYNYGYMDNTKQAWEGRQMQTEANHAILNPAYYPKDYKPENLWGEAEKAGAEFPNRLVAADVAEDPAANADPGAQVVPLGPGESEEATSEEAVQARTQAVEELAKKDIEKNEAPVATIEDPVTPADEAETTADEPTSKVRRKRGPQ